ncbi:MAG: lipopolysaccharide biosynthesis protein [Gemmatimonadaceae bacterium]
MRIQLAWTMAIELLVMISGVLLLKVAASVLGPVGFGEYALSRRAIGLMYLPLVLGLGIAAPRYIAIARSGATDGFTESAFVTATLTAGLIPPGLLIVLLNVAPVTAALLLFGDSNLSRLVPPATVALGGIALHSMLYAVYRGRSEMRFANALQFLNIGLVPLVAFALSPRDAAAVLLATGIGWLMISAVALLHVLITERRNWDGVGVMQRHLKVLLRFGVPRVPGEFALVGLFAIPSLLAVREHGVVVAGQFSAAMSLLTIASGAFAPIGLVVLPRASAQAAAGDIAGVRQLVLKILAGGILLATVGVVVGELLIPAFIEWYFGAAFLPAIPIFRACLLGTVPYVVYILMRNVLDALDVKAVNTRNLLIALGLVVGLCLVNTSILWMAFSLVASLLVLGVLTLRDTFTRLRLVHGGEAIPVAA